MASQSTLSAFAVAAERVMGAIVSAPAIATSQPACFAVRMNEWSFFITSVLPRPCNYWGFRVRSVRRYKGGISTLSGRNRTQLAMWQMSKKGQYRYIEIRVKDESEVTNVTIGNKKCRAPTGTRHI